MEKPKCQICDKDAKIVKMAHWRTGMIENFVEGTCGSQDCIKDYTEAMEEGFRRAEEERDLELFLESVKEE